MIRPKSTLLNGAILRDSDDDGKNVKGFLIAAMGWRPEFQLLFFKPFPCKRRSGHAEDLARAAAGDHSPVKHQRPRSGRQAATALIAATALCCASGALLPQATHSALAMKVNAAIPEEDYQRRLEAYLLAQQQFEAAADAYWAAIAEKRRGRIVKRSSNQAILREDYVLSQPPVYAGPPQPVDPSAPADVPPAKKYIPVVADFLHSALEHFGLVPRRPQTEIEFKRAYATAAAAAGISKEQAVRIYGFEAGGDGAYEVQAGLEQRIPGAQAISTALGYNQLLATNSVSLTAEKGDRFIAALRLRLDLARGEARSALEQKLLALQRMVEFCRSVPDEWNKHEKLAATPKGVGVHALNLDLDVGPLLQTQKLLDSILFAPANGISRSLSAAELEMMNLTGDGNGLDMIMMPAEMRTEVPTANFFQRTGYERNPIAIRHNVVAALLAATDAIMDRETTLQGAKDLAAAFPK
jgi:hypothetical protein